jgi:hypothetical protein
MQGEHTLLLRALYGHEYGIGPGPFALSPSLNVQTWTARLVLTVRRG